MLLVPIMCDWLMLSLGLQQILGADLHCVVSESSIQSDKTHDACHCQRLVTDSVGYCRLLKFHVLGKDMLVHHCSLFGCIMLAFLNAAH